jgi:hypothetical protein
VGIAMTFDGCSQENLRIDPNAADRMDAALGF